VARSRRPFPIYSVMMDVGMTLMGLLAGILGIVLSTSTLAKAQSQDSLQMRPGDIAIEVTWPKEMDVDVDLWVKGPQDQQAVGYSRRADIQSSYVRDDVGLRGDPSDLNYESSFIRGLAPGRYVVNLHLYSARGVSAVPCRVVAYLTTGGKGGTTIARRELTLTENGQERTAFSWFLDSDGKLEDGSVSEAQIPLRNAGGNSD
jgi:hypothetical protein